jgi:tRNA G18 (ribose-2'-O)-methylase SpoU
LLYPLDHLDHPLLDPYRDLNRSNRTRHDDLFVGEGRLIVERMLRSDFEMVSVVLGDQASEAFRQQIPASTDVVLLNRKLVSRLVGFEFHSGVIGCARRRRLVSLLQVRDRLCQPSATVVICPSTDLPDNLGSIARLCAGFGVTALMVGPQAADPFSRRAIRVSMGNILHVPVIEPESTAAAIRQLRGEFGFRVLAATGASAATPLPLPRPAPRLAIVLGNEADGISAEILAHCDEQVTIPMSGGTDSLNVAHAAAVLLYQFTRIAV